MSVFAVTLYFKMLSGNVLTLSVPSVVTSDVVYERVYRALPDDIRPPYSFLLSIFPEQEEQEQEEQGDEKEVEAEVEEIPQEDVPFPATDGGTFLLLINELSYEIRLDYLDDRHEGGTVYDRYHVQVVDNVGFQVGLRTVLISQEEEYFFAQDFIWQTVGWRDEEMFRPLASAIPRSIEEVFEGMDVPPSAIPGLCEQLLERREEDKRNRNDQEPDHWDEPYEPCRCGRCGDCRWE